MSISHEKFGLSNADIALIRAVFSDDDRVEKVIIYGSRAKGNFKLGSDIDLTIIGESSSLDCLLSIESALDELLLPFKFDLSLYKNIENSGLLKHIGDVGQVFYEKAQL